MQNKIINPVTGRMVSVFGKIGQSIIRNKRNKNQKGGGDPPSIYLALSGNELKKLPKGFTLMNKFPEHLDLLAFLKASGQHIYKLPVNEYLVKMKEKYGTLLNVLHTRHDFENNITTLETIYLNLIKRAGNINVKWDTSGKWGSIIGLEKGTGIAGIPHPDAILLGFTNY